MAPVQKIWRWYWIRLWFLLLSPVLWIGCGVLLERTGHPTLAHSVFPALFAAALFPAFFGVLFFRCPRCKRQFYIRGRETIVFQNRCQSCGLRAGESPEPSAQSESPPRRD
jgi:hypothetical protein